MLPLALLCGFTALVWALFLARRKSAAQTRPSPRARAASLASTLWVAAGGLLVSLPLIAGLPALLAGTALVPHDAIAHLGVARAIALHGLPHGWVDLYQGGFAFGPHYQSLPLLALAALIRIGGDPVISTNALGLLATLLGPALLAMVLFRLGLGAGASLFGAACMAWVAPLYAFIGGWPPYLSQGLLSQVVAMPVLILAAAVVIGEDPLGTRPLHLAPLLAALGMGCHAQLTVALVVASAPCCLLASGPRVRRRWIEATFGAGAAGLALYGPGLALLEVPLGWADVQAWKIVGLPAGKLFEELSDGRLLDARRAPALTVVLCITPLLLLPLIRERRARAVLIFVTTVLACAASGAPLSHTGILTRKIVEAYSPVRMLVWLPPAVAVTAALAAHEVVERIDPRSRLSASSRRWFAGRALRFLPLLLLGIAILPERTRWAKQRVALEREWSPPLECGPATPAGFASAELASVVRAPERGRLLFEHEAFPMHCAGLRGLERHLRIPAGHTAGGPASVVGILGLAFEQVRPGEQRGAQRAESLAVRNVLTARSRFQHSEGWRIAAERGDVLLIERTQGDDEIGLGCVVERWAGSERALRDALMKEMKLPQNLLDSPELLVELERGGAGPMVQEAVDADGCNTEGGRVALVPREPGAYEAQVSVTHPVDVVIRATYLSVWQVWVDGKLAEYRRVAPGFLSVRVPPGTHRIEAQASAPRGYLAGISFAALLITIIVLQAPLLDMMRRCAARLRAHDGVPR